MQAHEDILRTSDTSKIERKFQHLLEESLAKISDADLRLTGPRRAILNAALRAMQPFSVTSLDRVLASESEESIDTATIYRTLVVFARLGIIEQCDFAGPSRLYRVKSKNSNSQMHHLVCRICNKIEVIKFNLREESSDLINKTGFKNLKHKIELIGDCPSCIE